MSKFIELTRDGRKCFYDCESGAVIEEDRSGGSYIGHITNHTFFFDETVDEIMQKICEAERHSELLNEVKP